MLDVEEIGAIAAGKSSASVGSFRELLKNAVQENQQGVSLEIDMVVVFGRKSSLLIMFGGQWAGS